MHNVNNILEKKEIGIPKISSCLASLYRLFIVWALYVIIFSSCAKGKEGEVSVESDAEVKKLIPLIQANEILYNNIELEYDYSYKLTVPATEKQYTEISVKAKQISQGDYFWFDYSHLGIKGSGDKGNQSRMTAYDGTVTRSWIQDAIGNIHYNRVEDPEMINPFKLLNFSPQKLLSDFLSSGVKNLGVPEKVRTKQEFRVQGNERVGEYYCIKIECDTTMSGMSGGVNIDEKKIDYLWICPEKNYLPIKIEHFNVENGKAIKQLTRQVEELIQIADGVYFPVKVSESSLKTNQIWSFKNIKLNPSYPIEKFRDVHFGKNAIVYFVKDGKIVTEYRTGQNDDLNNDAIEKIINKKSSNNAHLIIVGILICIMAIFLTVFFMIKKYQGNGCLFKGRS
jgi:hypothetical protein